MRNNVRKSKVTFFGVMRFQGKGGEMPLVANTIEQPERGREMTYENSSIFKSLARNRLAVSIIALSTVMGGVVPAYAAITNTATVTGTPPGGTPTDLDTATEEVDVLDDDAQLTIVKTAVLNDGDADSLGDAGETITYTYTVTNSGNTTMNAAGVVDTHDGAGTFTQPTFASWTNQNGSPTATSGDATIIMLPGAIAVFETTYTIVAGDISGAGGTGVGVAVDGDIDNSAVANGTYPDGSPGGVPVASTADTAEVPLDVVSSLALAKVGYTGGLPASLGGSGTAVDGTTDDLAVGTTVTYVYTVTNDGNVPIQNVGLADVHDGLNPSGLSSIVFNSFDAGNTGGSINDDSIDTDPNRVDILEPGDIAYFTATYVIDQLDIDQRQ